MSCLKTILNNSLTKHVYSKTIRPLSTSSCLNGRKSRTPYDRRYGPRVRDVQPGQTGGSELAADLVRSLPRANSTYILTSICNNSLQIWKRRKIYFFKVIKKLLGTVNTVIGD